jgi:hypothetical protein
VRRYILKCHAECIRAFARRSCRKLKAESIGMLFEWNFRFASEQGNRLDVVASRCLSKRANYCFAVGWPVNSNHIKGGAFRKAKVFGCVGRRIGVMKGPSRDSRRTLSIDSPRVGTVDRLSIHIQPGSTD